MAYSQTSRHKRAVEKSRVVIYEMADKNPKANLSWSAGKDSTAMVHLGVQCGVSGRILSVKDDLDFPGEVEYLHHYALEWGVDDRLDIRSPPFLLTDWLREHPVSIMEDLHSRCSEFSDSGFYKIIWQYHQENPGGVYLGLRIEESLGRKMNYYQRGAIYHKLDGQAVCQPIAHWTGMDVFAYLFTNNIEPLHVYRAIGHHDTPERIRKSWWVMGVHSARGAAAWLRQYYPSLYQRLKEMIPDVSQFA
jgi:3'-phosphoadenosine 5'-phosphosulfate sulfotransferase (PAPS reductase)/FAD synthetase